MTGKGKAKDLKRRFNKFMGKTPQVNLKKHNIPLEEHAAYSNKHFSFNPFESRHHSGFGGNSRVKRKDLNVEF